MSYFFKINVQHHRESIYHWCWSQSSGDNTMFLFSIQILHTNYKHLSSTNDSKVGKLGGQFCPPIKGVSRAGICQSLGDFKRVNISHLTTLHLTLTLTLAGNPLT